jgi:hypothetical protein
MFKKTLIPTNGSETSAQTIHGSRRFAEQTGADITQLYVMQASPIFNNQTEIPDDTRNRFTENTVAAYKQEYLTKLASGVRAALRSETIYLCSDSPYFSVSKHSRFCKR